MDFQTYITNAVAASIKKSFENSDQLTLGEIISKCEAILATKIGDDMPTVYYDFGDLFPTNIDSWRGIYAELALNHTNEGESMKLDAFIEMLKKPSGQRSRATRVETSPCPDIHLSGWRTTEDPATPPCLTWWM